MCVLFLLFVCQSPRYIVENNGLIFNFSIFSGRKKNLVSRYLSKKRFKNRSDFQNSRKKQKTMYG